MVINAADFISKLPVKDVLLKFLNVYKIVRGNKVALSEIPSGIEKIDRIPETNIFPKRLGVKALNL
ncbi:MAG: hypothetical protein ACYCSO_06545 [Cuniculiplasma sp.]